MSFHDIRLSVEVSFGATVTIERRNQIVELVSGHEERTAIWRHARRRYNLSTGIKDQKQLAEIVEFFQARGGSLFGFRFKDWLYHKSCESRAEISAFDQLLGHGDGWNKAFQLKVSGPDAAFGFESQITKPVRDRVLVSVGDRQLRDGADYSVNFDTGLVTLQAPPENGAEVRAGFEFDIPVRFESDHLTVSLSHFDAGEIPDLTVIEVKG
jgi:uncharacterized protein (TIGR02217 family)